MRKLKLNIDALSVESFAPSETRDRQGTIVGHETEFETCFTCEEACGGGSLYQTCVGWHTCHGIATCNFVTGCYTENGIYTCDADCPDATRHVTCTCPEP
jgi:hypothetical protein